MSRTKKGSNPKFPSSNDPWKSDWVQIIRESRKEYSWIPSKSSVICSIHFMESDLYSTKCGLLRVVTYALPQKFLYETTRNEVQLSGEASTCNDSYKVPLEAADIEIKEEFIEADVSSASQEDPLDIADIKIKEEFIEANVSNPLDESALLVEKSPGQGLALQQSCRVLLTKNPSDPQSSFLQESPKVLSKPITPPYGIKLETPLSVLYTPKERQMKERLMKMHTLAINHKKKIKSLNQKVRRLQAQNKSLKDILSRFGVIV